MWKHWRGEYWDGRIIIAGRALCVCGGGGVIGQWFVGVDDGLGKHC